MLTTLRSSNFDLAVSLSSSWSVMRKLRADVHRSMPYEGQLATTGNFASPLSPHEQYAGECFKFR